MEEVFKYGVSLLEKATSSIGDNRRFAEILYKGSLRLYLSRRERGISLNNANGQGEKGGI